MSDVSDLGEGREGRDGRVIGDGRDASDRGDIGDRGNGNDRSAARGRLPRRRLLRGALTTAAAAAAAGGVGLLAGESQAQATQADEKARAAAPGAAAGAAAYPFHGAHQAGITTPKQSAAAFVSFDLTATGRAELTDLLKTLTQRLRFLSTGGLPDPLGIGAPPPDSGLLGPVVPADGLTATVALGSSVFDGRYGLSGRAPHRLRPMDTFPDDDLDPAWCHGDLLLQLCAHHPDTVSHALRDLARHTRGGMQVRWRVDGFNSPPRPSGTPRNLFGFRDGTANPATTDARLMSDLIWVGRGQGEPSWAVGGSYLAVRLIKMLVEFWDRVTISEQERMFGRRRDSGAPLDGSAEFDTPDYAADPTGSVIPLDAHMRLADPRTAATADSRFLRRGYNYDRGTDANGDLDMGLVFCAYQQDLDRQFVTVQKRLAGEPLVDYVSPYGGGYFFALPGVADRSDWYGRALLT